MTRSLCRFLLLLLLGTSACGEHPVDGPPTAIVAALGAATGGLGRTGLAGRDLYVRYCAICHGVSGTGDGFNASNLPQPPPSLAERTAALGRKGIGAHVQRGANDLYPQSQCPPYGGNLTEDERRVLLGYVVDVLEHELPGKAP